MIELKNRWAEMLICFAVVADRLMMRITTMQKTVLFA